MAPQHPEGVPRGPWWWINWVSVVLGAGGLAWMLHRLDGSAILTMLRSSGTALAACVILDVLALLLRARVLHVLLRPAQRMVGYPRVVVAQAAGSALTDLTPTGILGDAARASMLLGHVPAPAIVSAIVGYDLLALYVPAAVLSVGAVVVATSDGLPPSLEHAVVAGAVAMVVCAAFLSWLVRRGLADTTLTLLARLGALSRERQDRWHASLATLDGNLRELHTRARGERIEGLSLLLVARALGWIEMYVSLRVVGVAPDAGLFAALVQGQMLVGRLSSVVPLGLGISDAGSAALFTLFGLSPAAGIAYALLRRVRVIASALLGLGAMAGLQIIDWVRHALSRSRGRQRQRQRELAAISRSRGPRAPSSPGS